MNAPLGKDRKRKVKVGSSSGRYFSGGVTGVFAALVIGLSIYPYIQPDKLPPAVLSDATAASDDASSQAEKTKLPGIATSGRQDGANVERQVMDDGSVVTKFSPRGRESSGPLIIQAQTTQDPRLAGLPNDDLIEETPEGKLPIVGPDGLRPFDYYARPWSGARGTRIAIVVAGLGISQTGTMRAIEELPEQITLAFAANGNSLSRWAPEARRNGHEILLQVPMEPFNYPQNDPGRGTLVSSKSAATNIANLHAAMGRMTGYTGIMNYLGGRFLAAGDALQPVMQDIGERGLMFFDDGTSVQSLSGDYAKAYDMPHAFADLVLDEQVDTEAILKKLDELERIAYRKGTAIGVASGFDESLSAIAEWAQEAGGHGIEIVGVSALADNAGR
nr:divergent polysaccharide deacetylase family protein [Rhizobium sp. L1K21]